MDKFVIKKNKTLQNVHAHDNNNREPHETVQETKEKSGKVKHKTARNFNLEWENVFFVTQSNNKTICLLCHFEIKENRKFNVERHFSTKHPDINSKFELSSEKRSAEVERLKNELHSQQNVVKNFLGTADVVSIASHEIAFNLAKHGKPYTDGDLFKSLLQSTVSALLENVESTTKSSLPNKISMLPLSANTISRRVRDIGSDIETKLKAELADCTALSIALDETSDVCDISQLLFWVRYAFDDRIKEALLALVPLHEKTCAEDLLKAFIATKDRFNIDLKKLVGICTDGAPAMVGKRNGFVALLKKYMNNENLTHEVIAYHCIIHQENLCAKMLEKNCTVLKTVTKV